MDLRRLGGLGAVALALGLAGCGNSSARRTHSFISVNPPSVDFGNETAGGVKSATITLANTGGTTINFASFVIKDDTRGAFSVGTTPTSLEASATATVTIQYAAPAAPGADGATLVIDSDADNAPEVSVSLAGRSLQGCVPETDLAFCARMGATCGPLGGTDNCGASRSVTSCGTCNSPETCGGGDGGRVCGCSPESDAVFCADAGAECGTLGGSDNCGLPRTGVFCGVCTGTGQSCGGADAGANRCGCQPEDALSFCADAGAQCGTLTGADNCGATRTGVFCGNCTGTGQACGAADAGANHCGCAPLAACPAGDNCGTLSDGCGGTVSCGGACTGTGQTCGGGGMANVCGCTPLAACPAGDNCGTLPNGCGGTVSCGGACTGTGQTCGGGGMANVCGCTPLAACPAGDNCGTLPNGCGGR